MDRGMLERHLERGLSLSQIGVLVNRDPSTVGYWIKKYGLVANGKTAHAPRGGIDEEVLEIMCEDGGTLDEIAQQLDRSMSTS